MHAGRVFSLPACREGWGGVFAHEGAWRLTDPLPDRSRRGSSNIRYYIVLPLNSQRAARKSALRRRE
jgi:hypothetical protein